MAEAGEKNVAPEGAARRVDPALGQSSPREGRAAAELAADLSVSPTTFFSPAAMCYSRKERS